MKTLEDALVIWLFEKEKQDARITDEALIMKAWQLSMGFPELLVPVDFTFSRGWLGKFKARRGIRSMELHGEARSVVMEGGSQVRETLAKVLSNLKISGEHANFTSDDIFNIDETGLNWRQQPSCSLVIGCRAGSKKVMKRVTLELAFNKSGIEKLQPITMYHKAGKQQCFPQSFNVS